MKRLTAFSALLVAGSLAACGNNGGDTPKPPVETPEAAADWEASIASLQALAGEDFSLENQLEADLAPINEALPDFLSISWDDKSLDEATGATLFTGLTITIATDPEFGIRADEAEVWGLNTDLISARLSGERLDESGLAFNRLEARGASYFGVANAMNTLFNAMEETIREQGDELEIGFDVETFDSTIREMVMSNVSLRPYEIVPVSDTFFYDLGVPDEEMTEEDEQSMAMAVDAVRLAQQVVAIGRSLAVEDGAVYDSTATFDMTQPGIRQQVEVSWEFYGYEDLSGLDAGRVVVVNASQAQTMAFTGDVEDFEEIGLDGFELDQLETTAFMSYQDFKLDKLAGFLARAEFPSMDERDLLSFGTWMARDYTVNVNGEQVFAADRADIDATEFEWFIPEDLKVSLTGAALEAETIANLVMSYIPSESDDAEAAEFKEQMRAAIDTLDEHGLETLPFDLDFALQWDTAAGGTSVAYNARGDGLGAAGADLDIVLPGYDALQAAFESEDREAAFEETFQDAFAFVGLSLYEEDLGGYDKLFGYVGALGKIYPDQGWAAMAGNMDPQQMRNFIATMVRPSQSAASKEFPPAADWLEAMAKYYEASGGRWDIKVNPPEPLTIEDFEALDTDAEPEQLVEEFGIEVTHTPE